MRAEAPALDSVRTSSRAKTDIVYLVAAGGLIAAAVGSDRAVQRYSARPGLQNSSALRNGFRGAGFLGDPGSIVFSAAAYFDGLAIHSRAISALGMYTGESVVLGGVVAEAVKGIAGRSRPKIDTTRSHDFQFGRGFSNDDYGSFPSAETTIAFAAATGSTLFVRRQWPSAAHLVTPIAYTAATLVGLSRIYKQEHWASDVVTGAVLGSLSGVAFNRWNQSHPNNIFERVFLPRAFSASNGRVAASWSFSVQ